jgi:SAM-dependent methyltransferase
MEESSNYRDVYQKYYSLHFRRFHDPKRLELEYEQFYYFWKKNLERHLSGIDKQKGKILELGSGMGQHLFALQKLGFQNVQGVDVSPEQVKILQDKGFSVLGADATKFLAGKEDEYDLIFLFDVIEHFRKDEIGLLLKNIQKALRPGGLLLIETFNATNPSALGMRYIDNTHEIGFTRNSLESFLRLGGFEKNHFLFFTIPDFFVWKKSFLERFFRRTFFWLMERMATGIYFFLSFPAGTSLKMEEFKPVIISLSRK